MLLQLKSLAQGTTAGRQTLQTFLQLASEPVLKVLGPSLAQGECVLAFSYALCIVFEQEGLERGQIALQGPTEVWDWETG